MESWNFIIKTDNVRFPVDILPPPQKKVSENEFI